MTGDIPTLYIAHEFLDALPVHHFQRTSRGWRERLVDIAHDPGDAHHLRLVLAPNETPASKLLLPPRLAALSPDESEPCCSTLPSPEESHSHGTLDVAALVSALKMCPAIRAAGSSDRQRDAPMTTHEAPCWIGKTARALSATRYALLWLCNAAGDAVDMLEVCPQGMGLAAELAKRVSQEGGAALVVDYGRDAPYPDSLQAIREHSFVHLLSQPGLADLSAHVDFSALRCVSGAELD